MSRWGRQQHETDGLDELNERIEGEERSRQRRPWRRLLTLALLVAGLWCAPQVVVLTQLRERPLQAIVSRLDATVASGSAAWSWFGPTVYRNIVLHDADGQPLLAIERAELDAGLFQLASQFGLSATPQLGTLRLSGVELVTRVDANGSDLERLLSSWKATQAASRRPELELEVVDAGVLVIDTVHADSWRLKDLVAAAHLTPQGLTGWTVAGRAVHAGRGPQEVDAVAIFRQFRDEESAGTHAARIQVATQATALMAREGGFSLSSPQRSVEAKDNEPQTLVLATHRLPLGISELAAVRYGMPVVLDGHADMRVDVTLPVAAAERAQPSGYVVEGRVTATDVHVLDAALLQEQFRFERVELPVSCLVTSDAVVLRECSASSPLFHLKATGQLPLRARGQEQWLETAAAADFTLAGELDLAAVAAGRPGGLQLRPDVRVTEGSLKVAAVSRAEGERRVIEVRVSSEDLEAMQGERPLRWDAPLSAWLRGSRNLLQPGFRIDEARIVSPAFEVSAVSDEQATTQVTWTADLERLVGQVGELLDLPATTVAGTSRGSCRFSSAHANGSTAATLSASVDGFALQLPGHDRWSDDQLQLEATAVGQFAGGGIRIEQGHARLDAGLDVAELTVASPWTIGLAGFVDAAQRTGPTPPAVEVAVAGALERWHARLASLWSRASLANLTIRGSCDLSGTLSAVEEGWRLTRGGGELADVAVELPDGRSFEEPRVVGSVAGTLFSHGRGVEISSAEVLTATLSVRSGGFAYLPRAGALVAGQRLPLLRGVGQWQADVGRMERWLVTPLTAATWPASGRVWGTFDVSEAADGVGLRFAATGNDLALGRVPAASVLGIGGPTAATEVWREPRATFLLEVTRQGQTPTGDVTIKAVTLESSTAAVQASGILRDLDQQGFLELTGTASYDWDLISRLATPWTGGRVLLSGSGGRPFTIRGPLQVEPPEALADDRMHTGGLPVDPLAERPPVAPLERPDDWLAAARGLEPNRPARGITRSVSHAAASPAGVTAAAWLRSASLETTLGWRAADVFGVPIAAGDMPMRLLEGQLAFGPFDLAASGGRLRGTPWVRFLPGPAELVVPPGRIVERVDISQGMANRWMTWVAPLLGHAAEIQGRLSIDTAGTRVPLADPFGGQSAGQVIFEGVEVTPGPPAQPLVTLIGRLQALFDPRFGIGDKVVMMRVRPEPVRIWLHERRIWHEGLVIDAGQLTVRTRGSVAEDGTLDMDVELAFRGDIAGQTPIVATLLRTPLLIPLKGTLDRPQFDASAIDQIFVRIAENTANAVIGEGLSRGLEAMFGNPQPPAPPR